MVYSFFNRKMFMMLLGLLIITTCFSSCDSLRKKFVRQKKQSQESQQFIPVLQPEEYIVPEKNTVEMYKQHYMLIKAWYADLWVGVTDKNADNMVKTSIKQINDHIEQMKVLLKSEKSSGLDQLGGLLKYYQSSLSESRMVRNYSRIQSDLRAFDRKLRGEFRVEKIKGSLVSQ
jgi:hypothetical protein